MIRSHGDLIEEHIPNLLDSKQPDAMSKIISARMYVAKRADEEVERWLNELTPEARGEIEKNSEDLLLVHSYVTGPFNSSQQGWETMLSHVKMKKRLAEDPELLSIAEDRDI